MIGTFVAAFAAVVRGVAVRVAVLFCAVVVEVPVVAAGASTGGLGLEGGDLLLEPGDFGGKFDDLVVVVPRLCGEVGDDVLGGGKAFEDDVEVVLSTFGVHVVFANPIPADAIIAGSLELCYNTPTKSGKKRHLRNAPSDVNHLIVAKRFKQTSKAILDNIAIGHQNFAELIRLDIPTNPQRCQVDEIVPVEKFPTKRFDKDTGGLIVVRFRGNRAVRRI